MLERAGLLTETRQPPYVFCQVELEAVQRALRTVTTPKRVRELASQAAVDDDTRDVLRAFFDGPRLRTLPVQGRKKDMCSRTCYARIPRRKEYAEPELKVPGYH